MSKNDGVREPDTDRGSDGEAVENGETVDIGIGIAVSVDLEADEEEYVELQFDETPLSEPAEDGTETTPASDATGPTAGDESRLSADELAALEAAAVDPDTVREKECTYRTLLDAGVDESTAGTLRRRFSLPWSFGDADADDLERRSSEVRGLGEAEREWIAVSADEEWQDFEYDRSPIAAVGRERPSERPWPKPTPVTAVMGVGPDDADALAEAGVVSAERLATVSAFDVATALDLDVRHVRTWRHNARELLG